MKLILTVSLIVIVLAALTSTKKKGKKEKHRSVPELSADSGPGPKESKQPLVARSHKSLFDLRGELRKKYALTTASVDPRLSLVCSPFSALLPLGKLALGAEGKTAIEIWKAIGVHDKKKVRAKNANKKRKLRTEKEKKWIKGHFKDLLNEMKDLKGSTLKIASRIYLSNEKTLSSSFKSDVESVFKSSIELVNMKDPVSVTSTVNSWVNQETGGYIKDFLKPSDLSRHASLLLVNAIYFKGTWQFPFKFTKYETFYSTSGEKSVPMMHVTGQYRYGKSDTLGAQIVEIPYTGNKEKVKNRATMLVILPMDTKGLPLLLNQLRLAPGLLNGIKLYTQEVKLSIPKFKIESELDMGNLYKVIGLGEMFTEKSGLTSIVKGEAVYVSKAKQKAVIEVTENGTTAAAASVVQIETKSLKLVSEFIADHPFLFYIKYKKQQLFAGVFNY